MHSMFHALVPLVLASGSPRRQQFLRELGLPFEVLRPDDAEAPPEQGESPEAYAGRTARVKAQAVAVACTGRLVLAADTIVVLRNPDGQETEHAQSAPLILGKPQHEADSLRMLQLLAGRTHEVITAVCLLYPQGTGHVVRTLCCTAQVCFHPWDTPVLAAYARTGEPLDKAGGYAVQGQGAFLVAAVHGSWSTVVGLPVTEVVADLLEQGVIEALPLTPLAASFATHT